MKKLALALIVLLLAGIGLTFVEAGQKLGKCICPANTTCSQSTCVANCGGPCANSSSVNSSTIEVFQCGSHCPMKGCGNAKDCKDCCGPNCTVCCGKVK